ncbi:hypothetical protein BQ8420_31600 [Nocardiopsis sp. JB363]|nr:hypothetical protein BQ8420_31600 [Nocardiopsis sp. JB363]
MGPGTHRPQAPNPGRRPPFGPGPRAQGQAPGTRRGPAHTAPLPVRLSERADRRGPLTWVATASRRCR